MGDEGVGVVETILLDFTEKWLMENFDLYQKILKIKKDVILGTI